MSYEVQQFTLCDGWTNTWTVLLEDGSSVPETFATRAEAEAALAEFLADIADAVAAGYMEPDGGYSEAGFRIVKAGSASG
ncbi:hypothetical protein [Pannonibacter carbonis]|uniref:hypothetical protein n=1 Tax=Pannonibacter carbonis TaxID=2067569 RepID=UPI000D1046B7|nr:hypothetical protein [Pannonibacter carbonis]